MRNQAMIGGSGQPYVVYGEVRGKVSQHRTLTGAVRSAERDRRACKSLPGGKCYSDVCIYLYDAKNEWKIINEYDDSD